LARTGQRASSAVARALADSVLEVQLAAARALGRLKQPEPLAAVVESSAAPIFVAASMRALAQADPERAVALAAARVRHSEPANARRAIASALSLRPSLGDANASH